MSQFDFGVMDPKATSGRQLSIIIGQVRDAVNSGHAGPSRPEYAVAGLEWIDTSGSEWLIKRYDGVVDTVIGSINPTAHTYSPAISTLAGEVVISAGAVTDLAQTTSARVAITGGGTIGSFGTTANQFKIVRFSSVVTLTNSATLAIPGGSIATAVNDVAIVVSDTSGNFRIALYQRADGKALVAPPSLTDVDIRVKGAPASIVVTENTTLLATDTGSIVQITTSTPMVLKVPTPTNTKLIYLIWNNSSISQTVTVNGAGWIYGQKTPSASYLLRAGERIFLVSDIYNYVIFGTGGGAGNVTYQEFNETGVWYRPDDYSDDDEIWIQWWGAGGGGGVLGPAVNYPGAGGGYREWRGKVKDLPAQISFTVGAGGAVNNTAGGGATTLADFTNGKLTADMLTAPGGGGSAAAASTTYAREGKGGTGGPGGALWAGSGGSTESTNLYGSACGGDESLYGGNGGQGNSAPGQVPGGGGARGGPGAAGQVRFTIYGY